MSADRRLPRGVTVSEGARASGTAVFVIRTARSDKAASDRRPTATKAATPAGTLVPPASRRPPASPAAKTQPPPPMSTPAERSSSAKRPARRRPVHRRAWAQGTAAAVFLAVIVSASLAIEPAPHARAAPTGATPPTRPPAKIRPSAPPAVELSGSGTGTTRAFVAAGGLAVLTARYGGSSSFSAEIDTPTGQTVSPRLEGGGPYVGSVGTNLQPGAYVVKVAADGPWSVTITEPRD
jgi:hypothetical protein